MRSKKIPMTIDEFHLAEFPFGWKDEYWDGHARLSPREHGILMKTAVENRAAETFAAVAPISEISLEQLIELFYLSFVDSVEFCDYTKAEIKRSAEKNIKKFFDGKRGIPSLELSRAAVARGGKSRRLIGACLVSKYKYGFKNEILFVHPKFQNKGVGTILVSGVINDLKEKGEKVFWSEHHICNDRSAAWHKKFGFVEEPDILTAKLRRNYQRRQIERGEQLDDAEKIKEIKLLLEICEAEVKRLEKIEEKDFRAAWLSWKYDY